MFRLICLILLSTLLFSCTSPKTVIMTSNLQQGRRYFEGGFYKEAMQQLLPLASDGIADAQYAVGYMYYYGYGVPMDKQSGYFWIQKAAIQQFPPAIKAIKWIDENKTD